MELVESQKEVVYNGARETRPYIPPRSSTAAIRLHAFMQRALRDSWFASPNSQRWGASSVGRALRSQRRGRGFNSPALHQPSLKLRLASQTKSIVKVVLRSCSEGGQPLPWFRFGKTEIREA